MAYTKINKLQRIIKIQDITLDHTNRGISQRWVYEHVIYPRFLISLPTFYNYLASPAKRDLRELLESS